VNARIATRSPLAKPQGVADAANVGVAHAMQWKLALGTSPRMECASCPHTAPLRFFYRCLYCSLWFCEICAGAHFGETKGERAARVAHDNGREA
jgi:hypothetical protein